MTQQTAYIFGAGDAGIAAYNFLKARYSVKGYIDNDAEKQAIQINGLDIYTPEKVLYSEFDYIFIASEFFEQIEQQLITELGLPPQKVKVLPAHAIKITKLGDSNTKPRATQLLGLICKALSLESVDYFVDAGSLLGIVRDNELIPWDDDLDIAIAHPHAKQCLNTLNKLIPKLEQCFGVTWQVAINYAKSDYATIKHKDIASFKLRPVTNLKEFPQVDFFIKYINGDEMYHVISSRGFTFKSKHMFHRKNITFKTHSLMIPREAESYLQDHYGDDWRTPKKEWHLGQISNATVF
ncbi:hypothetical protein CWB85_03315 [Pseudoalteromonas sp. S1727]|uniref:LicD family protein n=1 Tax=Pseudoalteromonas sp. S1727 TaxID=2066514 RepID=UPI0011089B6A|nr:LicD family protein [Pseudoalteromonas sp. S1727]TMN73708.1 hypothetical protein CWB85_03315 [Pseudoalteromonas sp. S1727]